MTSSDHSRNDGSCICQLLLGSSAWAWGAPIAGKAAAGVHNLRHDELLHLHPGPPLPRTQASARTLSDRSRGRGGHVTWGLTKVDSFRIVKSVLLCNLRWGQSWLAIQRVCLLPPWRHAQLPHAKLRHAKLPGHSQEEGITMEGPHAVPLHTTLLPTCTCNTNNYITHSGTI